MRTTDRIEHAFFTHEKTASNDYSIDPPMNVGCLQHAEEVKTQLTAIAREGIKCRVN